MEFEIKGQQYRSGKLDAFKQFHVARRLAPLLGGIAQGGGGDFSAFLQPMAEAIAHMPDADCDYILNTCLAVVQRQQGNAWASIMKGKEFMFDDIDMGSMIQITVQVIQENLGGFFSDPAAIAQAS